jgi:hypothetical protein
LNTDFNNQINKESGRPSSSRRGSSALVSDPDDTPKKSARRSKFSRIPSRQRRESQTTDSLRREFASEGDDSQDSQDHPKHHRKVTKRARMDSIIDYSADGGGGNDLHEANMRLHRLEEGMKRLESLILQIIDPDNGSDDEPVEGRDELQMKVQTGILE